MSLVLPEIFRSSAFETSKAQITRTLVDVPHSRRLWFHIPGHTKDIAWATSIGAEILCDDQTERFQAWYGAIFHDVVHNDTVTHRVGSDLLRLIRVPDGDGVAELASADFAEVYLEATMHSKEFIAPVKDFIGATRYAFENSILIHPFIGHEDPKKTNAGALALAKADLLHPLMLTTPEAMQLRTFRFFLERYPLLTEHLMTSDDDIPGDSFEELRDDILPVFATEEQRFMPAQLIRLDADSHTAQVVRQKLFSYRKLFDLDTFLKAHQLEAWGFRHTPAEMTRFFRQILTSS